MRVETRDKEEITERSQEVSWLFSQNLSVYTGEWVAVLGQKIIAHGHRLKDVRARALAISREDAPFFYAVPPGFSAGR